AETMARIIQELLFLASVRREDVTLELLDMGAIVTEVQRRFTFMLEKSGGEIVAPEVWPRAYGHPAWVEEVWANYISNALKYGGAPPKVVLGAAVELDGARVRFWVQDNGVGLAPQAQQALFNKPFTRLEQVRAKGHGLGLSIVARIIQKMGGQVGVASEVGRGSTFSFTLPASP
ncbi:MAG: HAMP domain-containing histidine kinase, partial [Anaerolineae bacterium]|nr:HAMP domain-containing histidine kinase [Anaerolineae bacterium]